jgi:threonine dehydrogenase-like Zn-dependent dehydrogenase
VTTCQSPNLPGEALIRVTWRGYVPPIWNDPRLLPYTGIPGHEFVGLVMDSPANQEWVGHGSWGDQRGLRNLRRLSQPPPHCNTRKTLGIQDWPGAFAEYLTLPIINLHPIPDWLPDVSAVFTEPLAAAQILEQVAIRPRTGSY